MTNNISFEELLAWTDESAVFWKAHLEANPALLELPCGIGRAVTVNDLIRHIWSGELIWGHRIAGLPELPRAEMPAGPIEALFELHVKAVELLRSVLNDPAWNSEETIALNYDWLPPQARVFSRRKAMAHTLFHSHRHWAQLATLIRVAGFPSEFQGDLIFSRSLE
jgi:uncharacterized damage-inducible protein DinB